MDTKLVTTLSLTAVVAAGVGAAAGFVVARKQLELKYEELAKKEIAEAKNFYKTLHKKDELETPEKAVATLIGTADSDNEFTQTTVAKAAAIGALKTYNGEVDVEKLTRDRVKADEVLNLNVFVEVKNGTPEEWEAELRRRTEEAPYILNKDEYEQNESGYTQVTLTYYAGDETLCDERDDVIEEQDDTIGLYNLKRFGHWSEDARVVYVRNDVKQLEFEILLHDGTYKEIVAGF